MPKTHSVSALNKSQDRHACGLTYCQPTAPKTKGPKTPTYQDLNINGFVRSLKLGSNDRIAFSTFAQKGARSTGPDGNSVVARGVY